MRKLEFTTLLRRVADGLGAELPAGCRTSLPPRSGGRKTTTTTRLRRAPSGGFVAKRTAPTASVKDRLSGASRRRARRQACGASLRPHQIRDGDRSGTARRSVGRARAIRAMFAFQGQGQFVGSDARRAGRRGARACAGLRRLCAARPSCQRRARSRRRRRDRADSACARRSTC